MDGVHGSKEPTHSAGGDGRGSRGQPTACGALGRFDRGRVARIAALTGPGLREIHRDRRSALWLDRDPIRWAGEAEQGLAWSESPRRPGRARDWTEAASALDACGLVLERRRRFVHSCVSGMAPLYWMRDGGATYFCSSIDPLVQTADRPLRPDWAAWAAILRIGYTVGSRTPFEEVRRLERFSTLEDTGGSSAAVMGRWPWAEEPLVSQAAALDGLVEALGAEVDALAEREFVMGLSGGADSRLLLAALVSRGAVPRAATLPGIWGLDDDAVLAAQAADAVGIRHDVLPHELDGYWRDAEAIARATDYQQALEWAWFAPLARRFAGHPAAVAVDGLAGDILVRGKFAGAEQLAVAGDLAASSDALWRCLRRGRNARGFVRSALDRAVTGAAREQLDAACRRLEGHPATLTLALYEIRTTCGMCAGARFLGRSLPTATPFTADAVARAAISCPPQAKLGGAFHAAAIRRLEPRLAGVPNNSFGAAPDARPLPERRRQEPALEGFLELLRESPFRRWFRGPLREAVDSGPAVALDGLGPRRLVNGFALHALWLRRYRDRLVTHSPRELLS